MTIEPDKLAVRLAMLGPGGGRLSQYAELIPYDDPTRDDERRIEQLRAGIALGRYLFSYAPEMFVKGLLHWFQAGDPFAPLN